MIIEVTRISKSIKNVKYRKFIVSNPFDNRHQRSRSFDLAIKAPPICPLCGGRDIAGRITIRSRYITPPYHVNVLACYDHFKKRDPFRLFVLSVSFLLFIFFISVFIFRNGTLILLSAFLIAIVAALGIGYTYLADKIKSKGNTNYFFVESFHEGTILHVKREEWADEFKRLNTYIELDDGKKHELMPLEELESHFRKILPVLVGLMIMNFAGFLASLFVPFFFHEPRALAREIFIPLFFTFLFLLIIIYYYIYIYLINHKIKDGKADIYFSSLEG